MRARGMPSFNKSARKFVALLEDAGFEFDRVNSKGICFYTHPSHTEQRVNPVMTDHVLHNETQRLQRLTTGVTDRDRSKRDAVRVKGRQAKDREQAAAEYARLEAERAVLVAERDDYCARLGTSTVADANAIVAQIEATERQMKYWAGLMTETPSTRENHAKHRA
jgi:hypothetical protein